MTKFNGKFSEDIVKEVRKDFERRRQERKPLELQWRLNMNFYNGLSRDGRSWLTPKQ